MGSVFPVEMEVSYVEENHCSAECINPLLRHDIDSISSRQSEEGLEENALVGSEETSAEVLGLNDSSEARFILYFGFSISASIIIIILLYKGHLVPGLLLSLSIVLFIIGILAWKFCS